MTRGETTGLLHTEASRQPSAAELGENCLLGAFPDSHQPLLAQHSSVHRAPDIHQLTESQTVHVFAHPDQKADFKLIRMFLSTVILPTTSSVTTVPIQTHSPFSKAQD